MPDDLSAEKDVFIRNLNKRRNSMATHDDLVDVLSILKDRVYIARQKHPDFAEGPATAFCVIYEELKELWQAITTESEERQIDEAIDVAVTAIRFILGEHKKERPLDRASA